MQATLIAEEMDLEPGQFETSYGEPNAAYYNTALADEAVPFKSTDDGFAAETMRSVMGGVMKVMGMQLTGGSTSVPDSYDKLRIAGAVARETLKAAAAAETGVAVADLKTEAGAVVLPDGTALPYTQLAAAAAGITPVQDVTLRDPSTWRLIGRDMQRSDIVAKSTGLQDYTIDLAMEDMVHATIVCNPRKFGVMNGFDASEALSMRGVRDVLEITGGVCVLADNTWRAFEAAQAIEFDWGPAPYPAEQDAHWQAVAESFSDAHLDKVWRDDGDAAANLGADVIEAEYRAPYVAHQPLEPLSAVVKVTEDQVDIWASHQIPREVQNRAARIIGLDVANVHFHNQFSGGSFGHKLEFDWIDRTVEAAVQVKGTPIKMTLRREEDFIQNITRQIGMSRSRGAVENGQVKAWDLNLATPSVTRSQMSRLGQSVPGPDVIIPAGAWNMPYAVPNLRVAAYAVPELAPITSWRSVGASTSGFFAEGFLDELIHAAGADPMEERLRLCNNDVARGVLEAVAEMSNWGADLGPNRGRGVAMVDSFGVPTAEVVEVTATEDGIRIDNVFVALDVGRVIDPVNFENQVQGGVVWALGHAINSEITYSDGIAEQDNYHMAEGMRLYQTPSIEVRGLETAAKIRGVGEPPVPPAAPALANAIFAATGQRLREMPFNKFVDFV
jgi:isoquinoline 1-oxidoreductase beta subunit